MHDTAYGYASDEGTSTTPSFMGPLKAAQSGASELAARISLLANRLVGPVPPSNTSASGPAGKLASIPTSVFDQINETGRSMNGDIATALDAIARIERALP